MRTGKEGIDLIKEFEGLHLTAYSDPIGIPTIGYGHTQGVYMGQTITQQQADDLLRSDLFEAEQAVNNYVLPNVDLTQNQFDALVSLVFNVGSYNIFTKQYNNGYGSGSSLYNLLIQGNVIDAAERFEDFIKAGGQVFNGLIRRRKAEKALFKKKAFTSYCSHCGHSL